jgi:FkbM family methyltransferase
MVSSIARDKDMIITREKLLEIIRKNDEYEKLLTHNGNSPSQLGADTWVLGMLKFKRDGFFVEAGALDGYTGSNTYIFEKYFGWEGILSEPIPSMRERILRKRNVYLDQRALWSESGQQLSFTESVHAGLSTMTSLVHCDYHGPQRVSGSRTYKVTTVSLTELLDFWRAPNVIDYISLDTEGSELSILSHFDFGKYRFRCMSVEHNNTPQRDLIRTLLSSHGYILAPLTSLSGGEDWFYRVDLT